MLIVWDYFGVVAQDAFWYTAERLALMNGMSNEIQKAQQASDLGLISWDDYTELVAEDIGVGVNEVRLRYQNHDIKESNILTINALPDHRHVLLSNASSDYLLPVMQRLGLNKLFEQIFVSSDIGYAKPDSRAFQHVLNAMSCDATESIMIDDSARNIDAARDLGMAGIVYDANTDIMAEIQKFLR
jgi:HAD superfamily hydrolase (TIGR01509 family)